jgi:hypothetical protein
MNNKHASTALMAFRTIGIPGPHGTLIFYDNFVASGIFSRFCFERNDSGGVGGDDLDLK